MSIRKIVQHLDQCDRIPACRTAPRMLRESCLGVTPEHRTGLVPCMSEESCCRVICIFCSSSELMDYISKKRILLFFRCVPSCIFGIERQSHIETVKPYLMRIYLLMPEFSRLGTRLVVDLLANHSCDPAVSLVLVAESVVKVEIYPRRTDMVHIIVGLLVFIYSSVLSSHGIRPLPDIIDNPRQVISA